MTRHEHLAEKLSAISAQILSIEDNVKQLDAGLNRRMPDALKAENAWLEAHTRAGKLRRALEALRSTMEEISMPPSYRGVDGPHNKVRDEDR